MIPFERLSTIGPFLDFSIPGPPYGKAKARSKVIEKDGHHLAIVYPASSWKTWKKHAQDYMLEARGPEWKLLDGPIAVSVQCVRALARSHWRKTTPVAIQPDISKPDTGNLWDAVADAGTGVLWVDDRVIVAHRIVKWVGGQGEPAYTRIVVEPFVWG